MTAVDDWVLVARARADRTVFAELWRRHHNTVHGYILRRVQHRELAEDLTGDVFVRALAGLDQVADTGHAFGAWLATIARNTVLDHFKRSSTRREQLVEELPEVHIPGQRCALDAVDARMVLTGCAADLTDVQWHAIEGRFLRGLSHAAIAAEAGCTEGAAKIRQHRALTTLRRHLGVTS